VKSSPRDCWPKARLISSSRIPSVLRRIVYLVGAGPGAPDLISARGLRCLQAADVVVYDQQVHKRLLQFAPPQAERLNVGSASPQALNQEAICYLLAEKAR